MKTRMIEALGEDALQLPAQIDAGLAANDRLKYYFTLLQTAKVYADQPDQAAPSLKHERLAAGSTDPALDAIVASAHKDGTTYKMPGLAKLIGAIEADLRIMATPDPSAKSRLDSLLGELPNAENDNIDGRTIDSITRVDRNTGDSLHRMVMDLHKKLNTLQARLTEQRIDGAAVFHLHPSDEPLVRAFMTGVNRTSPLKFDHPGLGTTATRSGKRLVIQNDIGTTDAHVIVVHVEGRMVTLTYSDVHLDRLRFFQSLFDRFAVAWSDAQGDRSPSLAEGETFFLSSGMFRATSHKQLTCYLEFLGSRLVFLIDWNRARKQLRGLLRSEQRIKLLRWAADSDTGHRGFLALGGARLIYGAIEAVGGATMRFGDRLCDVLGDEPAFSLVQFALSAATEGLLARQSENLIRDRVRAELLNHITTAEGRLLQTAADHAGFVFEIATAIRDCALGMVNDAERTDLGKRARRWEHEADQLVIEIANAARRRPDLASLRQVIDAADDAADDLEEVAFLWGLLDDTVAKEVTEALRTLAGTLADASQEWIKALAHAQHVQRHGMREDADTFLIAIDRLSELEHDADEFERSLTVSVLEKAGNFRELHLIVEIGRGLEQAADSLKRAGLLLRDHVMSDVLAA